MRRSDDCDIWPPELRRHVIDFDNTISIRAAMHAGGWRVIPCSSRDKKPLFAGWPTYQYDPDNPEPAIPRTQNAAGMPTKLPHTGTGASTLGIVAVDIDVDDPVLSNQVRAAFEAVADEPGCVRYRENSGRRMLIYAAGKGVERLTRSAGKDGAKLEIDADHGGQFVHLYGIHPSGAELQYEGDSPADIAVHELPVLDRETLAAAFKAAVRLVGVEEHRVVGGYSSESIGQHVMDLATGASITPAAQEIFRAGLFDWNAPPGFLEELIRTIAEAGLKTSEGRRYQNLLDQMYKQRVSILDAYQRKYDEMVEAEMDDLVVRGVVQKLNARLRRQDALSAVRRLTDEEWSGLIAKINKERAT